MGESGLIDYYDFDERRQYSEGVMRDVPEILDHILETIPGAIGWRRAALNEDRHGTDYWIDRAHDLPALSVDMKNREVCPKKYGKDDACIETTSVYTGPVCKVNGRYRYKDKSGRYSSVIGLSEYRQKPGWTIDDAKRTDLIMYTWPHDSGRRHWTIPFPLLCAASLKNWREWAMRYGELPTHNNDYLTLNVYVPRIVIIEAITEFTSGVLA